MRKTVIGSHGTPSRQLSYKVDKKENKKIFVRVYYCVAQEFQNCGGQIYIF